MAAKNPMMEAKRYCKASLASIGSCASQFPSIKPNSRLTFPSQMKSTGEDLFDDIISPDFAHATTIREKSFDGSTNLHTIDPVSLQAMLATQFHDFESGQFRYRTLKPLIGRSIFSSDGEFWAHSRALFRPQFARENINDLEHTELVASKFVGAIGDVGSDGWTDGVDLQPLLYSFTMDTATAFLFGESTDLTGSEAPRNQSGNTIGKRSRNQEFSSAFAEVSEMVVTRIRLGATFCWLGDGLAFRRALRTVHSFANSFVEKALAERPSDESTRSKRRSLVNGLATQTQDQQEIRNQGMAILFAGRDTTSVLLAWCFVRLALHPEIFQKLRRIIVQTFIPEETPSFSDLKACRYLQHFLNEVLRLHPPIPLNQRTATRNTTLPRGGGPDEQSPIAVRKGQVVLFSLYLTHRRKDLWGEDAEEFRPERWEEKRYSAWQFLPFLGGPRVCLGQQFALTEAGLVLVEMLMQFDEIEAVDRHEIAKMRKGLGLTMAPMDGVKVKLHRAE